MFGQAEGVRGNYKKNPNIYSQNAEYGEESKQQSTDTRIKTLDGVDKAVALDVTDAGIKAKQMSGSTKGMMGVADNIEGQQEFVNKTLAAAKNAEHRNQMLKDFENSGWTDANGKVNKGAFIAARAMLGANNMMASNSMGIGGSVVSGTIGATSDNTTVKVDGVDSTKLGSETQFVQQTKSLANMFNQGKEEANQLKLTQDGGIDYKNNSPETLARFAKYAQNSDLAKNTKDNFLNHFVAKVADETGASEGAVWATMAGAGVIGLNKVLGNPMGKGAGKIADGFTSAANKLRGISDETSSNTKNSSTNEYNDRNSNKPNDDHTQHKKSFNSDMQNYTENRNRLQEEFKDIGQQKQDLAAKYNSGKMSKEDYHSKLNGLDAKQMSIANDLDHIDKAVQHEEIKAEAENKKYTFDKMPEKSWFGKIQDAMSGGGSFRTKLSLTAGAAALGYGVDAQAREISPSSIKAIPQEEGLLKQASDMFGNMELAGGLTTLAAEGASKFSSIAKGVASFGAKVMPGVGMAFGAADGAYRASEGDTLGAAMSAGIAAASTLPVVGTGLALAGGLTQIATDAMGITGVHKSAAPQHQGFSTQPFGYHTSNAMIQEQAAQAQVSTAGNMATLTALTESRSGGFTLQEPSGIPVSFTTSKEAGHHIMMNNQDMGMPYQKFSSMMQNQEMAAQFSNALAGSDLSNKDGYDFMNRTLLDMDMKTEQANRRQRMFDNATATNDRLNHKETIQALKEKSKDEFEG